MSDASSVREHRRFPANYQGWLWRRVELYLFVSFVLANLFFVWAAIKAERYSVVGGICGFWLVALSPWHLPVLNRLYAPSMPDSWEAKATAGRVPALVIIIAGALLLWALSSTGPRIAAPG